MNIGYKGIASYYRISISEVYDIFQANKPEFIFIDVRNPEEWKKGIIPRSKKISLEDLESKIHYLDKSLHYIMVCHYGGRSSIAANMTGEVGFPNVYNFQGGMLDWTYNNYPLEFTE